MKNLFFTFFVITLVLLPDNTAQAASWPNYEYLGKCTSVTTDGTVILDFYSEPLKAGAFIKGFVTMTLEAADGSRESVGAYDALFVADASYVTVDITIDTSTLTIPFGKDVDVVDPNGQIATCSLEY